MLQAVCLVYMTFNLLMFACCCDLYICMGSWYYRIQIIQASDGDRMHE
jgi:hypothetical protein